MFIDAVLPATGHVVNNHRSDTQCAIEPFTVMSHVIHDQESLDRVHVSVAAAIIFCLAEGFVPGLQAHLFVFAPEVLLNHLDGVIQQFSGLWMTGSDRACRAK
ncbi:hypothetical protein SDC9_194010 [bioreactor metagenome]|uniref:Uncharacterized protein n=1 Tax=bioreactor metagenome TaxID=1076179 RepID=A0A645IDR0_9ZZZZ